MYSRSNRSGCSLRVLLAGVFIVVATVITFTVYQQTQTQTASLPTALANNQVAQATEVATADAIATAPATPFQKLPTWRIVADKANLLTEVTEIYFGKDDWDLSRLGQLAGHLQGTPMIGQGGNYVLAGHVELKDGSPGPFANIGQMKTGDFISIFSDKLGASLVMQYTVTTVTTVTPDDINVIRNHGFEELTLLTCSDWDQKVGTYDKRVVVHAVPVGRAQATAPATAAPTTATRKATRAAPTPLKKPTAKK